MTDFRPSEPSFFVRLIATGFFSGYSVFAPGTAGSAIALLIYCLLPPLSPIGWAILIGATFFVGVYVSYVGEKAWGKDPGYVVIDEFAGFFVTVALLPQSTLLGIIGFFVFRVLDVVKPPPARQSEDLPGGWGIMVDDVIAGIYGNLLLWGLLMLWPTLGSLTLGFL